MAAESDVFSRVRDKRVVPVVVVDRVEAALPLADALIAGGLPVAEITFRTKAAAEVIRLLTAERPELLVGAGTVLNADDIRRAKDCGARFAVAPGVNRDVVQAAIEVDLPFAPGVMTPTDVETALSFGLRILKYFPAEAAGGLAFLKSLSAPYKHLGVQFIPTGGITPQNVTDYLACGVVLAVGGTWVAPQNVIAAGQWDKVTENCRQIQALLSERAS